MGVGENCCVFCAWVLGDEESDDWDDSVCFDTFRGRDLQQANADPFAYDLKSIQENGVGLLCFLA